MTDYDAQIAASLARRGWLLAAPDDDPSIWLKVVADVQQVLAGDHRVARTMESAIDRAVTYAYCAILYTACNDHGNDRQHRAFQELWEWIYRRVRWRVDDDQDAEDVAQKGLMKVYQNLHQVKEPHGFLGWVSVIMHHEVGDYYARKGRADQFEQELSNGADDDDDAGDRMDDLGGPDSLLAKEIEIAEEELIRMIFECMPKKQRRWAEVLVALALRGQTVVEVADMMQITPGNVHLMYFRARKALPQNCRDVIELLLQSLPPSQRATLMGGKL